MHSLKKFVASTATAGILLTGCGESSRKAENEAYAQMHTNKPHQGLEALKNAEQSLGIQFVGNDDQPISWRGLEATNRGKPSTISFMFTLSQCGSTCPQTAAALNEASEKNPSLHHYIISVSPQLDHIRNTLFEQLEAFPNLKGKVTVLYPITSRGNDKYSHHYASEEQIAGIENQMQTLPIGTDHRKHSGEVLVYGKLGELLRLDPKNPDDNTVTQADYQTMANEIQERLETQPNQSPQR